MLIRIEMVFSDGGEGCFTKGDLLRSFLFHFLQHGNKQLLFNFLPFLIPQLCTHFQLKF